MSPWCLAWLALPLVAGAECASDENAVLATRRSLATRSWLASAESASGAWPNETFAYDPVQDFIDSWEDCAAFEYAVMFAKAAAGALILRIPVIGEICSLLLGVFFRGFGKDFSWAKPLIQMIQDWTKKYVSDAIFNEVNADIMAMLDSGKRELRSYEEGMKPVKQNVSAGLPINRILFSNLYEQTKMAARYGRDCMGKLEQRKRRPYFGRLLPLYLLCANFQMGAYAESINAGRYWEEHMGWSPAWITVSPKTMWSEVYHRTEAFLPQFLKSWDKWRRDKIGSWSKRDKDGLHYHNDFYLEEKWPERKILNMWSFVSDHMYPNIQERELLSIIKERHWKSVVVKEKIPMLRMYATLHRMIPGQEKNTSRPTHMPAELLLGPFSSFSTSYNGRWAPYLREWGTCPADPVIRNWYPFITRSWDASAEVEDGQVQTIQAQSGEILDQLVFESKTTTFKLPDVASTGKRKKKISIGARCGFSLLYSAVPSQCKPGYLCSDLGNMAELRLFRPDNTSTSWSGSLARKLKPGEPLGWQWGQYSTGSALCGFYRLWQVKRFAKDPERCHVTWVPQRSGNAIEFSFKWHAEEWS